MENRAQNFIKFLKKSGFSFFSGVPCSFLTLAIDEAIADSELNYVPATNEGEAIALAAGAWLAGRQAVVMCQNSGLGNMVNPLTSLNDPFQIPVLLIVTHRGKPGIKDEPQHKLMGEITPDLLELLNIPTVVLPLDPEEMEKTISMAMHQIKFEQKTVAIIIEKGVFSEEKKPSIVDKSLPGRAEALKYILNQTSEEDILIATTGKTGRELFTLSDKPNNLYCVGSMGYASALAQGIALNSSKHKVTVIDGDGAALMHPGNMATIGYLKSNNFVHVILNNGTYDSTGGQLTLANDIDFVQLAKGMGYSYAKYCNSLDDFSEVYHDIKKSLQGASLLVLNISQGSIENLGRPTTTPMQISRRLQSYIMG